MLEAGFWGFVGGLALLVGALIGLKARAGPRTTERCWAPEYMLRCSPAASRSIPTSPPWRPTQRDDDRTALSATRSLVVVRRRKLWGWGYEDDGSSARQLRAAPGLEEHLRGADRGAGGARGRRAGQTTGHDFGYTRPAKQEPGPHKHWEPGLNPSKTSA